MRIFIIDVAFTMLQIIMHVFIMGAIAHLMHANINDIVGWYALGLSLKSVR